MRALDEDPAELAVDAIAQAVIENRPDGVGAFGPAAAHHLRGVQQQPGELDVVAVGGAIQRPGLSVFRLGVPAPLHLEQDRRQGLEVERELDVARAVDRVEHPGVDQVDRVGQPGQVAGLAGHLVEGSQRLHHVHVDVHALAVSAPPAGLLGRPVRLHDLEVPAAPVVGHVGHDGVIRPPGRFLSARIAGGQEVLAEGVDGERLPVADLGGVDRLARPVGDPHPPVMDIVPVVLQQERRAHLRQLRAPPVAVARPVGAGHGIQHADLHQEGLDGFAGGLAVAVEAGQKAPALGVDGAVQPERQQRVGEVGLGPVEDVGDFARGGHGRSC